MSDFLTQYSVQRWMEACPQGYLEDTVYGHEEGLKEPPDILDNELMLESTIGSTVQLVVGERAALAASSSRVASSARRGWASRSARRIDTTCSGVFPAP